MKKYHKEVIIAERCIFLAMGWSGDKNFHSVGEGFIALINSENLSPSLRREIWKKGVK